MSSKSMTPTRWATTLSRAWGTDRFPVEVTDIALEFSVNQDDPIIAVRGAELSGFEGALYPLSNKGAWAILYNEAIPSAGRINFTLAHELGHYLNHRHLRPKGFECDQDRMLGKAKDAAFRVIEREADQFAAQLLMPFDDLRRQVGSVRPNRALLQHCAERYGASLTAVMLRWLEMTSQCAVLVAARDGFVTWCWRSRSAQKRGLFYRRGSELPTRSVAAGGRVLPSETNEGVRLARDVWGTPSDPVEIAIFADRYDMTFSLLILPDEGGGRAELDEEEPATLCEVAPSFR